MATMDDGTGQVEIESKGGNSNTITMGYVDASGDWKPISSKTKPTMTYSYKMPKGQKYVTFKDLAPAQEEYDKISKAAAELGRANKLAERDRLKVPFRIHSLSDDPDDELYGRLYVNVETNLTVPTGWVGRDGTIVEAYQKDTPFYENVGVCLGVIGLCVLKYDIDLIEVHQQEPFSLDDS